jgi:hypothetical protein
MKTGFSAVFLPGLKKRTCAETVIGNNLISHINVAVLQGCQENEIRCERLPVDLPACQPPDFTHSLPRKH